MNETYCAARLAKNSDNGIYHIAFPHPEEHRGQIDPVSPITTTPFLSPWRLIIIADNLNTLVTSTLATDVATPSQLEKTDFIRPGKAAWHWLRYGDESSTLEYINSFLDFSEKMKWQYILVDAFWDQNIGDEKISDFVKKAKSKNIDVILWYSSNGSWNDAPLTPKNKMHEHNVRCREFARLQKMGVKGVKIDFFGGDKQATMKLYLDILKDAADYDIMVNFHGTTVPRGWQRTWPNLMTAEAVRGMEYCTFDQNNADRQPQHCCMLPFTRNVVASMDFTPTVFNPRIRNVQLRTTPGFELALPVIFESGIQHLGLVPEEYQIMPGYVVRFLQDIPTIWNETHLVDGYPGKYVVMARRTGNTWYIGGINGTDTEKELTLDLSFLPNNVTATMITDGEEKDFVKKELDHAALKELTIKMKTNGGFTIVTQ